MADNANQLRRMNTAMEAKTGMGAQEGLAGAMGTLSTLGMVLGGLEIWQYTSTTGADCHEPLRNFFLVDAIFQFLAGAMGCCNVCMKVASLDKEQMKYKIRKQRALGQGQPFAEDPVMEQAVQQAAAKELLTSCSSNCIMSLLSCGSIVLQILGWCWYGGTTDQNCLPSIRSWTLGILIYKIVSLCCAPFIACCVIVPCIVLGIASTELDEDSDSGEE